MMYGKRRYWVLISGHPRTATKFSLIGGASFIGHVRTGRRYMELFATNWVGDLSLFATCPTSFQMAV